MTYHKVIVKYFFAVGSLGSLHCLVQLRERSRARFHLCLYIGLNNSGILKIVSCACVFVPKVTFKVGKRQAPLRRPGQAAAQSFGLKTPPVEGAFRRASPLGTFGRQSERTVRECSQDQGFSIASAEIAEG